MNRNSITWAAITLVLVCAGVAVLSPDWWMERVGAMANLMSATASLLTLVIALYLFNRFGVERELIVKQFESVCSLLKTLGSVGFRLEGNGLLLSISALAPRRLKVGMDSINDMHVLIDEALLGELRQITIHAGDVFLPPSIAQSVSCLTPSYVTRSAEYGGPNVLCVWLNGASRPESAFDGDQFEDEPLTLGGLTDRLVSVIDSIDHWLRQNSAVSHGLNVSHLVDQRNGSSRESGM